MKTKTLPRTDSIQELARFWETHDLTDFEDELEEVAGPVFGRDDSIRLRPAIAVMPKRFIASLNPGRHPG